MRRPSIVFPQVFAETVSNTVFKVTVFNIAFTPPALPCSYRTVFRTSHFRANLSFTFNTLFQTQVLKILVSVVRFRPWAPFY